VYLAYSLLYGLKYEAGLAFIRRSDDGGRTWGSSHLVYFPGPEMFTEGQVVRVLPGGLLLDLFMRANYAGQLPVLGDSLGLSSLLPDTLLASRSADGGRTWSSPARVASIPNSTAPNRKDPESSATALSPFFSFAVASDGTAYAVYARTTSSNASRVFLARSTDGGLTWPFTAAISPASAQALEPSVAVLENGTVGVSWYDTRNDRPGDHQWTADAWFAASTDKGRSWLQAHLGGPFDLAAASRAAAAVTPLGDYQGLAADGSGFAAAFAMASPPALSAPTEIFAAQITLIGPRAHR
jgi:Neuraminidase (sialidase)